MDMTRTSLRRWRLVLAAATISLAAGGCSEPSVQRPASAPSTPAGTTSPALPGSELADLPAGDRPRIAYVVGNVVVRPDGSRLRITLPHHERVAAVYPLGPRVLVLGANVFEGYAHTYLIGLSGSLLAQWSTFGRPAATRDGRVLLAVETSSEAVPKGPRGVLVADPRRRVPRWGFFATGPHPTVAGAIGDLVVFSAGRRHNYADGPVQEPGVQLHSLAAGTDREVWLESVIDVDEKGRRLRAWRGNVVQTYDLAGRQVGCDLRVAGREFRFSPSGRLSVTQPARTLSVFDGRCAAAVATWRLPTRPIDVVWESERSLLCILRIAGDTAIVRLRLDGSTERATPIISAARVGARYLLAGRG